MNKSRIHKKPPIGVSSKKYYDKLILEDIELNGGMSHRKIITDRMIYLRGAIMRYAEAQLNINIEWVNEYNNLLNGKKNT